MKKLSRATLIAISFSVLAAGWWISRSMGDMPLEGQSNQVDQRSKGLSTQADDMAPDERPSGEKPPPDATDFQAHFRDRVANLPRSIKLPRPLSDRSPSGEMDPLQCEAPWEGCEPNDPRFAASWEEAQWMRRRGFVDSKQREAALAWNDAELDERYRLGDPAAVVELARRFEVGGEYLAANLVLSDALKTGNVQAAYELLALDKPRSAGAMDGYVRNGLEWVFVARRMGDGRATMSYAMSQFPNLRPDQLDMAMLAADRIAAEYRLNDAVVEYRPGTL